MAPYPGVPLATVPVASNASPIVLSKGQSVYVFGQLATTATQLPIDSGNVALEAAPTGASVASIAVNLQPQEGGPPPAVSVEMHFNGAPGAGESIAIQEADTDADAFYITPAAAVYTTTVFNANNNARVDLSPTGGKFMRILRTKGANAVGCWVKITRLA